MFGFPDSVPGTPSETPHDDGSVMKISGKQLWEGFDEPRRDSNAEALVPALASVAVTDTKPRSASSSSGAFIICV